MQPLLAGVGSSSSCAVIGEPFSPVSGAVMVGLRGQVVSECQLKRDSLALGPFVKQRAGRISRAKNERYEQTGGQSETKWTRVVWDLEVELCMQKTSRSFLPSRYASMYMQGVAVIMNDFDFGMPSNSVNNGRLDNQRILDTLMHTRASQTCP